MLIRIREALACIFLVLLLSYGAAAYGNVEQTYFFNAGAFKTVRGTEPAPAVTAAGSFTLNFDPALTQNNQTSGVVNAFGNFSFGQLGFNNLNTGTILNPSGQLQIGGMAGGSVVGVGSAEPDFVLAMRTPRPTTP